MSWEHEFDILLNKADLEAVHGFTAIPYSSYRESIERQGIPIYMNWYDKPQDEYTESNWYNTYGRKVFRDSKPSGYVKPSGDALMYAIYRLEQTWII